MSKTPKTLTELFKVHQSLEVRARALYAKRDQIELDLVRVWRRDKTAKVDDLHCLEIDDTFRGQVKAFARAYAHRYNVKLKLLDE